MMMHLRLIGIITLSSVVLATDPEESMNIVEMIRHWGYPVATHEVITSDDYVLSMYRMRGRTEESTSNSTSSSCRRPPIIFSHGLGADSASFVMNPPGSSPAMILADAGFDVFLLNHKGTTHCRKHLRLTPRDAEFWQFTLDEYANYDATAAVDRVLELSGAQSVYWIGHSQGTIVGFMMLADNPDYNAKVKALFQLGPVGTLHYARGVSSLGSGQPNFEPLRQIISIVGSFDIAPRLTGILNRITRFMCVQFLPEVCRDIIFLIAGTPSPHFNLSRIPVYASNYPCGTSTWNVLHCTQLHDRNRVEHFDYSAERNKKKYGQSSPPPYNYSRITSDVYLFRSRNDWLTSTQEQEFLTKELNSIKGTFEIEEYNHLDFIIATNNAEKVFNTIIYLVKKYENC